MEISAEALCKVLKIPRWRYQEWERAHMVVRRGDRCSELDAIEAAVVGLLVGKLIENDDVRVVMNGVRPQLRGSLPTTRARIICHFQDRTGQLVLGEGDDAIGRLASTGWTVLVLDATDEIRRVREAFRREAAAREAKGPARSRRSVEHLRSKASE